MVSARGGHWRGRGDGPVCFRAWPHEWPCSHGYTLQRSTCVGEASPGTQNQEDTRIHILLRDRRRETDTQRDRHTERQTRRQTDTERDRRGETDTQRDRRGDRQTRRETDVERDTGRGRDGFRSGGESRWPRECVVGSSGLRRVGWQAGGPWGRVAVASRVQNLEAALGGKVGNSGAVSYNSACYLGAGFRFSLGNLSLCSSSPSTDGTRPTHIMGVISFTKLVDCRC